MIASALSLFSIVLVLSAVLPTFGSGGHVLPIAGRAMRPRASIGVQRPNVVENGSNVVVRPFATPLYFQSRNGFAITPDGAVYFGYGFGGALYRFDLAGNLTLIPVKRAFGSPIIFAHHKLWTPAGPTGVVSVDPDGSNRTWYQLASAPIQAIVNDIATQGDGTYLATNFQSTRRNGPTPPSAIIRIGPQKIQTINLPVYPGFVSTGDRGNVYFTYIGQYEGVHCEPGGIGRIAPSGTITYFPAPNCPQKPVYSNGYLYFFQWYPGPGYPHDFYADFSKMNVTTGVVTHIGLPSNPSDNYPGQIAVDHGGNLWLSVETDSYLQIYELYFFDVHSGRFKGPIEPSLIANMYYGDVAVGPDDNVYSFAYYENSSPAINVYVKHVATLEPASLTVTAASTASFSILETHFNGPWTAVSLQPSIAAVFPATSANGSFSVAEVAHGTARIQVTDKLGNISYETVTAQ